MARRRRLEARLGADGLWHLWVTIGTRPNGRPLQRHVKRAGKDECEDAAQDILDELKAGKVKKSGAKPTVQGWMTTYLDTIAPGRCNEDTIYDYYSKMRNWVFPKYGAKRLDRFNETDLDAIYMDMRRAGKAQSHQLKVHRILSRALKVAHRRGHVTHNVALLLDPPSVDPVNVKALAEEVADRILAVCETRRNAARWSVAFALGLRQGEALGLRWEDPEDGTPLLDLEAGVMHVWWQLRRQVYVHGCGGTCGRKRGAECPQRSGGGLTFRKCKGKSKRSIPIPAELVPALRAQRARQNEERLAAKKAWAAGPAVFATEDGRLIEPRDDHEEWTSILEEAGVKHVKPHIMRHTAATILLHQGVELAVVQKLLGHRDIRTTGVYTQDVDVMLIEAVKKTVLRQRKSKIEGVRKGVLQAVE